MSLGESATAPSTDDVPGSADKVDKGLGQGHAQDEAATHSSSAGGLAMGMLGIDRKKMEEERLARLKKRKAGPTNLNNHDKREPELPPAQRPRLTSGMGSLPGHSTGSPGKGVSEAGLPYPLGIVRRTWAPGNVRRDDSITIGEVLQRDTLELAVLSSFQWDEEWLLSKLNLGKTKVLLVAYAADEETKASMRNNVPQNVIRFCFPPMERGCMHSKLMLLKYPKYLRIVVPTGNLVPYDWGETGVMENTVFLIDLPRINDPARVAANALTHFGAELQFFLERQGVDGKMVNSLRNYCSSIGAVKNDLMAALYNACKGDSGMMEYEARTGKQKKNKGAPPGANQEDFKEHMRVYFPSRDTVRTSRGGMNAYEFVLEGCARSLQEKPSEHPPEVHLHPT
ncbi:hypothetical protein INS49_006911 [Diaporthe citri]|uniref:uncharacterized protein n=1 Tax=Diaporthe citri TaxID=83186 RepID=UPI001C80C3AC|nr:uncharacterized protein INS49_006911 [Diaporthe citri]KAG6365302.1 hypothetical protein INS49_006911 [Diaporthe citri]